MRGDGGREEVEGGKNEGCGDTESLYEIFRN